MSALKLIFAFGCLLLLNACASDPKFDASAMPQNNPNPLCHVHAPTDDAIASLDRFSDLFESGCYREAIALGDWIRQTYREKNYSVSNEIFSVFAPEDTLSEYVLESYERSYLALLIAHAYLRLGHKDEAAVELRRAISESQALIYNFGDDPVTTLLAAALWQNLGDSGNARPFWLRLTEMLPANSSSAKLAQAQIAAIDAGSSSKPWHVHTLARFPELDWHLNFLRKDSSYYQVVGRSSFPLACGTAQSALLPTQSWLDKIAVRGAAGYHPLLNFKSWVRLPIGIIYGVTTFSLGLGVAGGGCAIDLGAKGDGKLCSLAIEGGELMMQQSVRLTDYVLKPDLRHWTRLPAAIFVTQNDLDHDECWQSTDFHFRTVTTELTPR